MKPLRLVLHAFGPYPETQEVDFERLSVHGLFLIHGPTGSGKSTLLDAIIYALFDSKTVERGGAEFVSDLDPDATTSVVFDFEARGARYRVTRVPRQERAKKSGSGTTTIPAEGRLERLDGAGVAVAVLADRVGEVTRQVEDLLGCDADQFRQTVVLPQGAFREVVTDDKTRREVLARVFATGRFAALTQRLKAARVELDGRATVLRDHRRDLLAATEADDAEALTAHLVQAQAAALEAGREREAQGRARDGAQASLESGKALARRFGRLGQLREALGQLQTEAEGRADDRLRLDAAGRAARVGERVELRDRVRQGRDEARRRHGAAVLALATATEAHEAAEGAWQVQEVGAREREDAERVLHRLEGLTAAVEAAGEQQRRLHDLREAAARSTEARDAHDAALAAFASERTDLHEAREPLAALVATAGARQAEVGRLEAQRKALARLATLETTLAGVSEDLADLERAPAALATSPDASLADVLHDHAAALLATDLQSGAPCPVCGALEHPKPHPHGDLGALRLALDAYQERQARTATLRARRQAALDGRVAELAAEGWDVEARPFDEAVQVALATARTAADEAAAAQARLTEIDARRAAIDREEPVVRGARETQAQAAHAASTEADVLAAQVATALASLPEDARTPATFAGRLTAARTTVQALTIAYEAARASRDAARTERDGATTRLAGSTERLQDAEAELARAHAELDERLAAEGFEDEAAWRAAALPADRLEALARALADLDRRRTETGAQVRELEAELEGRTAPDVEALTVLHDEALAAWSVADEAFRAAEGRRGTLETAQRELTRTERAYADLQDELQATAKLAQLAAGQLSGRAKVDFETFVLQSIFGRVLAIGNAHLQAMTGGRYALHLVDDATQAGHRGLELEVADRFAGDARRPAKTLSGGEGFLAALALALGLSESARRSSGGIELGALFVDEGFGSLDEVALERVVRILRELPEVGDRVVGVISHVEELKRRIPTQLLVKPTAHGSTIEVRVNA